MQVNTDDPGARHQIFPTIEVSNHALHVAWYDFRNSVTPTNEALDVYYSCTNCAGSNWPTFDAPERVTNVSHNGNCRMFGGGTVAFHGDYNELDAFWNGTNHIVHVTWADNRDVPTAQCDLSNDAGAADEQHRQPEPEHLRGQARRRPVGAAAAIVQGREPARAPPRLSGTASARRHWRGRHAEN